MQEGFFEIEYKYNELLSDLAKLYTKALETVETVDDDYNIAKTFEDIKEALNKAKLYDISKAKKSEGGRKAWANMTKEARSERAKKASHARSHQKTEQKQNKNRTKTEQKRSKNRIK